LSEAKLCSVVMHTRAEQITRLGLLNHSRSITVCAYQQLILDHVLYVLFEFKTAALGGHLSGTWFSKCLDGPDREPFWNIFIWTPREPSGSVAINFFHFFYAFLLYRIHTVSRFIFLFGSYTVGRTPWTSDGPVARPLPKYRITHIQNKQAHTPNIHALSGIRTHDHGLRASEDSSCLRTLGYRGRLISSIIKAVGSGPILD
jgi:hypothetical protein